MARSDDPSLECTWEKLNKQLSQCGYQAIAAELKADEHVLKEQDREAQVHARRMEMQEEHQKKVASLTKEFDISTRALVNRTEQDIEDADALKQMAFGKCKRDTQQADDIDRQSYILEKEVKRLQTVLEQVEKDFDYKRQKLVAAAEEEVRAKTNDDNREVKMVSLFAKEVQENTFDFIGKMVQAAKDEAYIAHETAQSRSKYDNLYQVAAGRTGLMMSEKSFQHEKGKIMVQWWDDWQNHVAKLAPAPTSLAQVTGLRPHSSMVPIRADRPRSVSLARERAMLQSFRQTSPVAVKKNNILPPVRQRPKTSP